MLTLSTSLHIQVLQYWIQAARILQIHCNFHQVRLADKAYLDCRVPEVREDLQDPKARQAVWDPLVCKDLEASLVREALEEDQERLEHLDRRDLRD